MIPQEPFFILFVSKEEEESVWEKQLLKNYWNFTSCGFQKDELETIQDKSNLVVAKGELEQLKWLANFFKTQKLPPLIWIQENSNLSFSDLAKAYPNCVDVMAPPYDMELFAVKMQCIYKFYCLEQRNELLSNHFNLKTQELIQALEKGQKVETELRELDKLKSDFTAMISHELRTPISVMKGAVGTLQEQALGPVNEEQMEFLNIISRNAERLKSLVSDFLDFSQLNSGQMKMNMVKQSIAPLITESIQSFKFLASQKNIQLKWDIDSALPNVIVDGKKIIQVTQNLLNNALKFTNEEGEIYVTAKTKSSPAKVIEIRIKDNGIGIPLEKLESVFEKFSQVDSSSTRKYGGTGLGLPICRAIIESHSGKIWAKTNKGQKGVSLIFQIPWDEA